MNPRKIETLRFIQRPFFELETDHVRTMMIEVMFTVDRITKGEEAEAPFSLAQDPLDFANTMLTDLQREIALRN
jgi:hypothetical protein